jgi:hypothetical protein
MWITYPTLPLLAVLMQVDFVKVEGRSTRWFDLKQENSKATTHTLYEEKNGFEMWHGEINQITEKFVVRRGDEPK